MSVRPRYSWPPHEHWKHKSPTRWLSTRSPRFSAERWVGPLPRCSTVGRPNTHSRQPISANISSASKGPHEVFRQLFPPRRRCRRTAGCHPGCRLDSRAYRLPWPGGTTIFELDQPQVLKFKREVLAERGDQPTAERREVAVDLREDWPQALRDSGFDPAKPSAWIAEGLLIYLPASAQEELFKGIDVMAAPGSHLAVEDGAPLPQDEFAAKLEEERAAVAGVNSVCSFSWSTTSSSPGRAVVGRARLDRGRYPAGRLPARGRPAGARPGYRGRTDDRAQHPGQRHQELSHPGPASQLPGSIGTLGLLPNWSLCRPRLQPTGQRRGSDRCDQVGDSRNRGARIADYLSGMQPAGPLMALIFIKGSS
ncbi:putative S-adenosyl-L-methionine-dependent methyltransferase [Mycobacterium xenopi 4042]|uniref:S-adenosyl-L-methionine-dependent methyltransferase n=1 Tax=Mycobacterium xenopi 4042 TaxID=1299334 RepID=X7ZBH4_MYCXE|nr:putative S-adenosyl-L-methionine-dependent methyltransferase [Mycobacterium xenopi 4042]